MWESWIDTGTFFSFFSSPAEQDPERGLRSPRKDRGGSASDRSGLGSGAEGDCAAGTRSCGGQTRPRGCRSLEQDGPGAAVRFDVGGTLRGGRAGLRNRSADFGGAMRSADLWGCAEERATLARAACLCDRIGRSAFDSSYSRNRDRRITRCRARAHAKAAGTCGTSAIDSKGESAGAGISGSTGSLGRRVPFGVVVETTREVHCAGAG